MYTNRLEDRISLSPSSDSIPAYHTRIHTSHASDSEATHSSWINTLQASTLHLYTNGSKMPSGHTGSGWALYRTTNPSLENIIIASNYCHLGTKAEVFDAELHAVHEGLLYTSNSDLKPCRLILCINNSAAIHTLADNLSNSEPARLAICLAAQLITKCWTSSFLWTPAHLKIKDNEEVDDLAKKGAEEALHLCPHAFNGSRAIFRAYCGRTPSDPHYPYNPTPCQCGIAT
jgi:ribonuclease HI